jgi:thiamine transport system permease protein
MTDRRLGAALGVLPLLFGALFFVYPVATILVRTLDGQALYDALADGSIRGVLWFTTWQAALSAAVTFVVGFPIAYVLGRFEFRGRRLTETLVTVPFVLPTVVVAGALRIVLPQSAIFTVWAILAANVFFNVAVVVRTVGTALSTMPRTYEEAARTLGASVPATVRLVMLPLLLPAIATAVAITFLFCFTAFGTVLLLGGPNHGTLEVEIYRQGAQLVHFDVASALTVVQLVTLTILVAASVLWQRRRGRAVGVQLPHDVRRAPSSLRQRWAVGLVVATTLSLLGAPMVALVQRSLRVGHHYGFDWYRALSHTDSRVGARPISTLLTSLQYGVVTAMITLVLATLAALAIIRLGRIGQAAEVAAVAPLATSAVTVGFGMLITFNRAPLDLRDKWYLVPIAHSVIAIPFVLRLLVPALGAIPARLREAAVTLGASPWSVLRRVELPLLRRPLAAAAAFAFAISVGEFGASAFLVRGDRPTAPTALARLLGRPGDAAGGTSAALAAALAAVTVVSLLVVERASRPRTERHARSS